MSYYAVVLVPHRVELNAETRAVASEEARDWARHQQPVHEHSAKVLSVHHVDNEEYAPLPPAA